MNEKPSLLVEDLAAACLNQVQPPGEHLTEEEILTYLEQTDGLPGEERLREHLVHCSRCLEDLFAADTWRRGPEESAPSDFEIAAAWRALREQLRADALARKQGAVLQQPRHRLEPFLAAAAVLCIVLGLHAQSTHRELQTLKSPQLNALIEDVVVPTERTRGAAPSVRVEVPDGVSLVTLVFPLPSHRSFATHRVDIETEDGRPIWHGEGVLRVDAATWTLGLPRSFLSAGNYRVRLSGLGTSGQPEELGIYPFTIDFPAP